MVVDYRRLLRMNQAYFKNLYLRTVKSLQASLQRMDPGRCTCYINKMKSIAMLDDSQSNTVVITTVGVLKSAFLEWADELAQSRKEAENDVMIDEAVVIKRLRKSRATLWRWNASGYLPCYKLGGKNQYKQSEVERIEKGLK